MKSKLITQCHEAGINQKSEMVRQVAKQMCVSERTAWGWVKEPIIGRKKRADEGSTSLTKDDALLISALVVESRRANGKSLMTISQAVKILRANPQYGANFAAKIDKKTGEILGELQKDAISRAMKKYHCHPDQIIAAAPAVHLRSEHPNAVWQIDASLCILYYLPKETQIGLQVMEKKEFYKNKIQNTAKIVNDTIWRYAVVDHFSGAIYVHYVAGGETAINVCTAFAHATQKKHKDDPVHGLPKILMLDPGAANKSKMLETMCDAIGVKIHVNHVGNARAKGSVEKANNIIETQFESFLKLKKIDNLEQLNNLAWRWMRHFNAHEIHSRHGRTRYAKWFEIKTEELIAAPSVQSMIDAGLNRAEPRKVNTFLEISWAGKKYSVSKLPKVLVGQTVMVSPDSFTDEFVKVEFFNDQKQSVFFNAPMVKETDGALIGHEYKSHAKTPAERNAELIEQLATNTTNTKDAEKARKKMRSSREPAFGGNIDPMLHIKQHEKKITFLPKAAAEKREIENPQFDAPLLNHYQCSKYFAKNMMWWNEKMYEKMQILYPAGIREDELEKAQRHILNETSNNGFKIVR